MRFVIFFSFLTGILIIFYFFPVDLIHAGHVSERWIWDKSGSFGTQEDPELKNNFKPNGYRTEKGLYFFGNSSAYPRDESALYEISFFGKGYLKYKKIGKSIEYHSRNGELLWQRETYSYPKSLIAGNLILLISGDNSRVQLLDSNGNPTPANILDGTFLSDWSNPEPNGSLGIGFSDGMFYKIDTTGKMIYFRNIFTEEKNAFLKSISISGKNDFILAHFFYDGKDQVRLFSKEKIFFTKTLNQVYPHKIYSAVSDSGNTMIHLPDEILIFNKNGKVEFFKKKEKLEGIHQTAVFCDPYFALRTEGNLVFFTEKGNVIRIIKNYPGALRLLSTGKGAIYAETQDKIYNFRITVN